MDLVDALLRRSTFKYLPVIGPETDIQRLKIHINIGYNILNHRSTWIRSIMMPFVLKGINLHHSMDNSTIFPFNKSFKRISTIHDMLVFSHPEFFGFKHRFMVQKMIGRTIKWSDMIITDSYSSKKELLKYFPERNEKTVRVVHLATTMTAAGNTVYKKETMNMKLPDRFLLSVGTYEPRKNQKRQIKAFIELKRRKKIKNISLVLVGGKGWMSDELFKNKDELDEYKIILLPFVDDSFLAHLYKSAEAFIYPSIAEGFGFPPLEAMSFGCPVIISNTSSLPEVGGDAARYVDPLSIESIEEALLEVCCDEGLRKSMSLASVEQSKKFSWDKTAEETEKIYSEIL